MSTLSIRRAAGVIAALALVMAIPLMASAESFSVELPRQIIRGAEGEQVSLGTYDVPNGLVGQVCSVTAIGNNNRSVHPGNDIVVTSASTVTLPGVEDAPNKTTQATGSLTIDEQVSFTLVLGSDPVYSAEFTITFDCMAQQTTTTTSSTTSSTTTSSTTSSTTTSTTAPTTTSTTVEGTSTTTTTPPPTTTPEEPETTSTTAPPVVQQETTTTDAPESTLPFTGADSDTLGLLALAGVVAGSALVLTTRQSEETKGARLD